MEAYQLRASPLAGTNVLLSDVSHSPKTCYVTIRYYNPVRQRHFPNAIPERFQLLRVLYFDPFPWTEEKVEENFIKFNILKICLKNLFFTVKFSKFQNVNIYRRFFSVQSCLFFTILTAGYMSFRVRNIGKQTIQPTDLFHHCWQQEESGARLHNSLYLLFFICPQYLSPILKLGCRVTFNSNN